MASSCNASQLAHFLVLIIFRIRSAKSTGEMGRSCSTNCLSVGTRLVLSFVMCV